jgi:carboxylesterase type B
VVHESGDGIAVVNFNYRVGALGFLAGPQVDEDGDLNVGLLDQRKALAWVQSHIARVRRPSSSPVTKLLT